MSMEAAPANETQCEIGTQIFGRFDQGSGRQTAKGLLDHLRDAGLAIGPRERVLVAALLAELLARLPPTTVLADLRAHLAPLLARSPREREDYFRVFDVFAPPQIASRTEAPSAPDGPEETSPRPWLWAWLAEQPLRRLVPIAVAVNLAVLVPFGYWYWHRAPAVHEAGAAPVPVRPSISFPEQKLADKREDVAPPVRAAAPVEEIQTVDRIIESSRAYDGAPTLDELARSLAANSQINWTSEAYSVRLQELTGLPRHQPLALVAVVPTWKLRSVPPKEASDLSPLERILALVRAARPGKIDTVAGPYDGGRQLRYHLRLITPDNRIFWYDIDAQTGKLLAPHAMQSVTILARLARALAQIERPAREALLSDYVAIAQQRILAAGANDNAPRTCVADCGDINDAMEASFGALSNRFAAETVANDLAIAVDGRSALPLPRDDAIRTVRRLVGDGYRAETIERAMAISANPNVARIYPGAPWLTPGKAEGVQHAPAWAAWLAPFFPLGLVAIWLTNSLVLRKAFLRRRAPQFAPLHMELLADAATHHGSTAALFQRIGQRLQRRSPRSSDRLDVEATVGATIVRGGTIVEPRYQQTRATAEYLVLIERRSAGDQDYERMRLMVLRLKDLLALDIYSYQSEPSMLEPDAGGASIPIERLVATYPYHRLLILGSGAEFLDPIQRKPLAGAAMLMNWERRALLTPVPLSEWAQEEFLLARELSLPIGRATPAGLMALADLLRLEDVEGEELLDPTGDGLARPLPDVFRLRPQSYLYRSPPGDHPVEQVIQDLRNYLDPATFDWLCALAVYPALQWDLTLYLGVSLARDVHGDVRTDPIYAEERVAALTQLPWMREGRMPDWLRRELIQAMPAERGKEVRDVLRTLLEAARSTGDAGRDEAIRIRIGREPVKERLEPGQLFDDEVLLDFLAKGSIEDFEFPRARFLDRLLPEDLARRFGWPELAAGVVGVSYAAAAYWFAPKPADGALITGAWIPLLVLGMGLLLVTAAANAKTVYRAGRAAAASLSPLAFALGGGLVIGSMIASLSDAPAAGGDLLSLARHVATTWTTAIAAVLSFALVPLAHWLVRRLRIVPVRGALLRGVIRELAQAVLAAALVAGFGGTAGWASNTGLAAMFGAGCLLLAALSTAWEWLSVYPIAWRLAATRFYPGAWATPGSPSRLPLRWLAMGCSLLALLPIGFSVLIAQQLEAAHTMLPADGGALAAESDVLATAPDGAYFATGSGDGTVRLFSSYDPKRVVRTIFPGGGRVVALAIRQLKGGQLRVGVASFSGSVKIYDGLSGTLLRDTKVASAGSAALVALGPDGGWAVAAEDATGVSVVVTDKGTARLAGAGQITALAPAGDGTFAYGALNGGIGVAVSATDTALKPKGTRLELRPGPPVPDIRNAPIFVLGRDVSPVGHAAFSPDGTRVVATSTDGAARVWDAASGSELLVLSGHAGAVLSAAYSPDGTRIVTASSDGTARVWDGTTGALLATLAGHTRAVDGAAFSPDGTLIVTSSPDGTARIWNVSTGKQRAVLAAPSQGFVHAAVFSPDGTLVVTTSDDPKVRLWSALTGSLIAELQGHTASVTSARFSPNGARLVTVSSDFTARIWDTATRSPVTALSNVTTAAFSPDGTRAVTASRDQTARVWDTVTGNKILELSNHTGEIRDAAYSPDGKRILTASPDGTVRLWDAATGKLISILSGHSGAVTSIAFSSDGRRVLATSADADARIWLVDRLKATFVHGVAMRSVTVDEQTGRLTATAVDGSVFDGRITGQRLTALQFVGVDSRLALGPAVPWITRTP